MRSPFFTEFVKGGFFAFIENGHLIADEDLFAMFGLQDLRMVDCKDLIGGLKLPRPYGFPNLSVLETDQWKMIGDDYFYYLHCRPDTKNVLRELSKTHGAVFVFMVSDDLRPLYEFRLLRDGEVVREYVKGFMFSALEPYPVMVDSGDRLEGEFDEAPREHELAKYPFTLAAGLGFDIADALALAPRVWVGEIDPRLTPTPKSPDPGAWF